MSQINDKIVEFARMAVSFEIKTEHFYRHAAETTEHPKGKAMFLTLAQQEQAHMADVGALFSDIIGEHEWQRIQAEEAAHTHPSSAIVADLEAAVASHGHSAVADDAQALRLGLELKRRAIRFLDDLASHTEDAAVVEVIRRLADEERYRYDFLQGQLDSVLNVGVWLDGPEFRMDGRF